jgi:TIR domain
VPENRKLKVFLCHSKDDKPKVRELYRRLVADGFDAWFDEEKLLPGQDWATEIPKAVRTSDVVAICISKASVTKEGYVQKEIRIALDIADEKPDGTIFLIPVKLEDSDIPERLSKWQWVNLFDEKGYEKIKAIACITRSKFGARDLFRKIF